MYVIFGHKSFTSQYHTLVSLTWFYILVLLTWFHALVSLTWFYVYVLKERHGRNVKWWENEKKKPLEQRHTLLLLSFVCLVFNFFYSHFSYIYFWMQVNIRCPYSCLWLPTTKSRVWIQAPLFLHFFQHFNVFLSSSIIWSIILYILIVAIIHKQ